MTPLLFDIETDGLRLEKIRQLHCFAWDYFTEDGEVRFTRDRNEFQRTLDEASLLAGHNIVAYDLRVLEHWGFEIRPEVKVLDTYLLSQFLRVDRAGHSIEKLAEEFGLEESKIDIKDFSTYTPELGERCRSDVRLNTNILIHLIEETGNTIFDLVDEVLASGLEWGRISKRGRSASEVRRTS